MSAPEAAARRATEAPLESGSASAAEVPAQGPRIRLAILDDHELLLDSMSSWITANAVDFDLTLSAKTWVQLVHSANFPTDLVIIDFQLREHVSIESRVRTCRAAGARVIVLSSIDTSDSRRRALEAGASAFLSKALPMNEIMKVSRAVMGVQTASIRPTAFRPLPHVVGQPQRPRLSAGETEAFRLYVSGLSTTEVARRMNVQYETAKTYLRRVREKYAKVDRPAGKKAELMRRAAEDGYLQ